MELSWFWLALLCAFSLASADALTKKALADYTAKELVLIRFGCTGLVLAPLVWATPPPPLPLVFWGWLGLLVPLEITAMWLYMRAIRDSPLALTLPYLAFTPVLTTLTGWLLLGEQVSGQGFGGILLVVVGAYLLNVQHARGQRGWSVVLVPLQAIARERGSRLMLAVATLYSLTAVLGKVVLQYMPAPLFGPFYFVLLGGITVLAIALSEPGTLRVIGRRPGWHVIIALLMGGMVVTHFLAVARVEVAYMIAVKRTSLLFGILYGALLFSESGLRRHLLAGGLMVAGVALILL